MKQAINARLTATIAEPIVYINRSPRHTDILMLFHVKHETGLPTDMENLCKNHRTINIELDEMGKNIVILDYAT